ADPKIPVFGIVTRLADQKGLDILSEICDELLDLNVQLVLLGDGDKVYQTTFKNVAARHPKNASVTIGFSQQQAHAIYAGADFFLMPSYYEPCGLSQMISMRYATVPIVRSTGGLRDTVIDVDEEPLRGNGFVFEGSSPEALMKAIRRALKAYGDPRRLLAIRKRGMRGDYSWKVSAGHYKDYYQSVWRRR
ncbi:MAG: glycosyltransferase, partial [Candidatus Omnitrophota bacterium]